MSQFTGGGNRVRCVDCTHLQSNTCSVKKEVVAPKKRRACSVYKFKGSYENRVVPESTYIPPVDKKTKQMIKRLIKLGVMPVREDGSVAFHPDGSPLVRKKLEMPKTTATVGVLQEVAQETPQISSEDNENEPLIWLPGQE